MGKGYSVKAKGKSEAEILIYEDVGQGWDGGVTAKQFADDLSGLGPVDTIHLRISSLGGDVNEGLAIHRRLVEHKARVVAHVDGWAASIASVIAMAGDEILISESGAIMIHDAWGMAMGNATDMRSVADRLDAVTAAIADVYVKRTSNDLQKVRDWMSDEKWFYGKEAVDAGFASKVAENMVIAARFDPARHVFRNAPATLMGTPNLDLARQRLSRLKLQADRRRAAA